MCGIIGIYGGDHTLAHAFRGLGNLAHRGRTACGFGRIERRPDGSVRHGDTSKAKFAKSITDVRWEDLPEEWRTPPARHQTLAVIGHTRYPTALTCGATDVEYADYYSVRNAQPVRAGNPSCMLLLATNGDVAQVEHWREQLKSEGYRLNTDNDAEILVALLYQRIVVHQQKTGEAIRWIIDRVHGSYSTVLLNDSKDALWAWKDARGRRGLCLGLLDDHHVVASESWAFTEMGGTYIREIAPGEIIQITANPDTTAVEKTIVTSYTPTATTIYPAFCGMEIDYFAHPMSIAPGGARYWSLRKKLGAAAAVGFLQQFTEVAPQIDLVCGVPRSGLPAAEGFATAAGLPHGTAILAHDGKAGNGRSYILPTVDEKWSLNNGKLIVLPEEVAGQVIVVVDDSIIEGNVSKILAQKLRAAGAKAIYLVSTWPMYRYACDHGGLATHLKKQRIADMCDGDVIRITVDLGWDGVYFNTPEAFATAVQTPANTLCMHCVTGERFPLPTYTEE